MTKRLKAAHKGRLLRPRSSERPSRSSIPAGDSAAGEELRDSLDGAEAEDAELAAEVLDEVIDEDEDIGILVLGAAVDNRGPGPLVSSLATGKFAGTFPIPVTIVPGDLKLDDIKAMA